MLLNLCRKCIYNWEKTYTLITSYFCGFTCGLLRHADARYVCTNERMRYNSWSNIAEIYLIYIYIKAETRIYQCVFSFSRGRVVFRIHQSRQKQFSSRSLDGWATWWYLRSALSYVNDIQTFPTFKSDHISFLSLIFFISPGVSPTHMWPCVMMWP